MSNKNSKSTAVEIIDTEVLEGEIVGNPFFCFNQNNSGGGFVLDTIRGISHYVIVQARDAEMANDRAESIGLYFGGSGDCPCCGDRWSAQSSWYSDSATTPQVYGREVAPGEPAPTESGVGSPMMWMDGPEGFIHYEDGRVEPFWDKPGSTRSSRARREIQ